MKGFKIFRGEGGYYIYDEKNDNISVPYTKAELEDVKSNKVPIEWRNI